MTKLGFFQRLKLRKYQPIIDYVEGRMTAEDFRKELLHGSSLKTIFSKWKNTIFILKEYNYNFYDFLIEDWRFKRSSWNNITTNYYLSWWLEKFLSDNNISFQAFPKYKEDYRFLLDIQPSWVDCRDDSILQPIIDSIPKDLSKTKRIAMGKEKIKALFKYDKSYPRWIQEAEWPIVNGKPLVFSHTENVDGNPEHKRYYFYDPDTNEQTVVEQFY